MHITDTENSGLTLNSRKPKKKRLTKAKLEGLSPDKDHELAVR